jgi:hypothetical protein
VVTPRQGAQREGVRVVEELIKALEESRAWMNHYLEHLYDPKFDDDVWTPFLMAELVAEADSILALARTEHPDHVMVNERSKAYIERQIEFSKYINAA